MGYFRRERGGGKSTNIRLYPNQGGPNEYRGDLD